MSRTIRMGDWSNHWFDKIFQLIIASNGEASVNFEHAWGDGVEVLRYLNEMYSDSIKYPVVRATKKVKPCLLKWETSGEIHQLLKEAKRTYEKWTSIVVVACAETPVTRAVDKTHVIERYGMTAGKCSDLHLLKTTLPSAISTITEMSGLDGS
ncbi:hypothetical protein PsorP6_003118 [Peronosclerospora sorghi]|uniref:Uncharacterized protein n=1 Tax=Peronosclerospora sorghi TaxID=230839 RepID=A0ACC0VRZ7_9STRA|nr:hypothetical protein PsorP6_003118 [Peronosclerospora sorghi]